MGRGTACYTPPMNALALYRQGRYAEALGLAQAQGEPKAAALALKGSLGGELCPSTCPKPRGDAGPA
jgi:hypothetical protein